ncbi:YciI family protein [Arthrobacter sp. HLT1-20]
MRYTLLLHYPEADVARIGAEAMAAGQRAFASYAAALHQAGALVSAEVLAQSASSTTLRMLDGVLAVQDGPFADTKEQLGGTFVIDVPNLDVAIDWGRRAPSIGWGPVEVRPGATHTVNGTWQPNT